MFSIVPAARTEEELVAEETMQAMMVVMGEAMKKVISSRKTWSHHNTASSVTRHAQSF
jgi:hypothetical protein